MTLVNIIAIVVSSKPMFYHYIPTESDKITDTGLKIFLLSPHLKTSKDKAKMFRYCTVFSMHFTDHYQKK